MANANEEIARRYMEEVPRIAELGRDRGLMRERLERYWEPDGDYYPVRKFPEARPCHGLDAIAEFFAYFLGAWDQYEFEMLDVKAIDDQRVLSHGLMSAQGHESGLGVGGELFPCFWMRRGKFFRVEDHLTRKGAIAALGISEPPDNEEIWRRSLEAFDRGDRKAWAANRVEDYEVLPSATWPEAEPIRGRAAAWDFYERVNEPFEAHAAARDSEVVAAGDDKLLIHHRSNVRGKTSGAEVEIDYWLVVTFRDRTMARDEWFLDRRAAAAAAAGVDE